MSLLRCMSKVLLLLAMLAVGTWGTEECTEEKVAECLAQLGNTSDVNQAVVIYMSETDLRAHCNEYEKFNLCMKNVRRNCSALEKVVFEGIDDAYHFLCYEAFDEYLSYRECFNNTQLHTEGMYCNNTLTSRLNTLDPAAEWSYRKSRVCQYVNDYLDCVESLVESFCGSAAATWQRELDERSLMPLLSTLQCAGITRKNWWEEDKAVGTWGTEECTEEKLAECLAPLENTTDVNQAVVIYMSETDLRAHCNEYEKFNLCMKNVRRNCGALEKVVFEGIDDAYHFLCYEAFDEYLSYRECFNNTQLHTEGMYCNNTLTSRLNSLDPAAEWSYRKSRVCQYANDYLDCVESLVESFCGSAAATWQRELDERALMPLLSNLQCAGITRKNWWEEDKDDEPLTSAPSTATAVLSTAESSDVPSADLPSSSSSIHQLCYFLLLLQVAYLC